MDNQVYVQSVSINYDVADRSNMDISVILGEHAFDNPKELCKQFARSLYDVLKNVHSCSGKLEITDDDFFYKEEEKS
ncbi:MAG: hypothetical protein ACXACY_25290 [Candidatus Hodarchaeales archaeon]|jgi:hypothetical protein